MTTIDTAIDIDAPRATVWETLTDFDAYPTWNPHITAVSGILAEGERLTIRVDRMGDRERELMMTVTAVEAEKRLTWVGAIGHRTLFKGVHTFELEVLDGSRTRLHNREEVSGLLASFFTTDEPERDYRAMNEALRARVE